MQRAGSAVSLGRRGKARLGGVFGIRGRDVCGRPLAGKQCSLGGCALPPAALLYSFAVSSSSLALARALIDS
jgi:hypothetical protein